MDFEDESYVMTEEQVARAARKARKRFMRDPEHQHRVFSGSTTWSDDDPSSHVEVTDGRRTFGVDDVLRPF